jgi:hypothetical protein
VNAPLIETLTAGSGGFNLAANVAASAEGVTIQRTGDGQVTLYFYVNASASVFNIATVPAGWRPSRIVRDLAYNATGVQRVTVLTDGSFYAESPAIPNGGILYGTMTWVSQ